MSTDLHDRPTPSPQSSRHPAEKPRTGLSLAQVIGGALASMTAAFLGSRLGLGGTVAGAALVSVTVAVGGTLYTSSLRRTHERVTQVWTDRSANRTTKDRTQDQEPTDGGRTGVESVADDGSQGGRRRLRLRWKPVLVGSIAIFALAALVLTGIELATGQALSGGGGTTITQVTQGGDARQPDAKPSTRPTAGSSGQDTPRPGGTPSTSPSSSPRPTESGTPGSATSADPSAPPSVAPTGPARPSASAQPSAPTRPSAPATQTAR